MFDELDHIQLVPVYNDLIEFKDFDDDRYNIYISDLIDTTNDEISFYNEYKAILRCQRDFEDEVRSSLALVNNFNRKQISISCIGISGTIKGCSKFI